MPEPTLADLADKIDDVTRMLSRQAVTLGSLADAAGRADGPDLPLLVELHALRNDVLGLAVAARTRRERDGFHAVANGLERLLAGRGGQVESPAVGDPFSASSMEVVEVVDIDDPGRDRTVAALHAAGLRVGGRSVRPARVGVYRTRDG